jgi:hypothetical protein
MVGVLNAGELIWQRMAPPHEIKHFFSLLFDTRFLLQ